MPAHTAQVPASATLQADRSALSAPTPKILACLAVVFAACGLLAWAGEDPLAEKQKTGRSIVLETVVEASPAAAFALWGTADGVESFFAPVARIDPEVGGRYELIFDPESDPEGLREGTAGARILRYEPPHFLAFEWKGREYMHEMNEKPLPTWVELRFEPLPAAAGDEAEQTRVLFVHRGFGEGGGWTHAYAYFEQAWKSVLGAMRRHFLSTNELDEDEASTVVTASSDVTEKARLEGEAA